MQPVTTRFVRLSVALRASLWMAVMAAEMTGRKHPNTTELRGSMSLLMMKMKKEMNDRSNHQS